MARITRQRGFSRRLDNLARENRLEFVEDLNKRRKSWKSQMSRLVKSVIDTQEPQTRPDAFYDHVILGVLGGCEQRTRALEGGQTEFELWKIGRAGLKKIQDEWADLIQSAAARLPYLSNGWDEEEVPVIGGKSIPRDVLVLDLPAIAVERIAEMGLLRFEKQPDETLEYLTRVAEKAVRPHLHPGHFVRSIVTKYVKTA